MILLTKHVCDFYSSTAVYSCCPRYWRSWGRRLVRAREFRVSLGTITRLYISHLRITFHFRMLKTEGHSTYWCIWKLQTPIGTSYLFGLPPPPAGKKSLRSLWLPPPSRGCRISERGSCIYWSHWRRSRFWWPRSHGSVRLGRTLHLLRPLSS